MTTDPTQRLTASRIELFSNFLERACALIAHATSYQETLERVGDLVVPLFADWCSIDLVEGDGRWRRRLLQQDDPGMTVLQETIFRDFTPDGRTPHPIMRAVATGRAELVPRISEEWIAERSPDERHAALLRASEVHSALFLPLYAQQELLGVLGMYAADPSRPSYDSDDLRFGELLATVVAAALRNVDYLTSAAIELAERRRVEGELRESLNREAARLAELRATEGELLTHRENLERMVQERTRALEESHARLRDSERMALIGTLSAGLGHDMGNLLLPLRLRLDALNRIDLPEAARNDLEGIATAVRYLQRLTSGLRLLARDPEGRAHEEVTRIGPWWDEVKALMKDALVPGIRVTAEFADDIPAVAVPQAALTQIVLNLIQNAGHALKGRVEGQIRVSARAGPDRMVDVIVSDNGPGMDEETRRRCFEPFFSTKRRQLSTGLGLAVVRGLVERAHGTIAVDSSPGAGATFTVTFRAGTTGTRPKTTGRLAWVSVQDPRARALAATVLTHAEFEVSTGPPAPGERRGQVWITDLEPPIGLADIERFLDAVPDRLAVVIGTGKVPGEHPKIKVLESVSRVGALRAFLEEHDASAKNGGTGRTRVIA